MFNGIIQQKTSSKVENFKILSIGILEEFTIEFDLKWEIKCYRIRTKEEQT